MADNPSPERPSLIERLRLRARDVREVQACYPDVEMVPTNQHWLEAQAEMLDVAADALESALQRAEQAESDGPPGNWRCDTCGFVLTKALLRAHDGAVGISREEPSDPCPNDGTPLRRLTWQEDAEAANRVAVEQMKRAEQASELLRGLVARIEEVGGDEYKQAVKEAGGDISVNTALAVAVRAIRERAEQAEQDRDMLASTLAGAVREVYEWRAKLTEAEQERARLQDIVDHVYALCTWPPAEIAETFGESRCTDDASRVNYMTELLAGFVSLPPEFSGEQHGGDSAGRGVDREQTDAHHEP